MSEIQRWQQYAIQDALHYRRVLILAGARQVGKTTLSRAISSKDTIYRTLDSSNVLEAALADPDGFVEHDNELMIIDEIQRAPKLLQAVKKNVDENASYGRFLLTGSANIQTLPNVNESLAGRVTKIRLRPLAIAEVEGSLPLFLKNAFMQTFAINQHTSQLNKIDYLKLAFRGGYPEVQNLPFNKIAKWHRDYLNAMIDRDLREIINIRRKDSMRKLMQALAAWSTKEINIQAIGSTLSLDRATIESYINVLDMLYLFDRVNAWPSTDYESVRKKDKIIITDTGLMSSLLKWSVDDVNLDGDRCGKLIENFVYQQLITILEANDSGYALYHYRDANKREIDFLVEDVENNKILGIEVKSGSAIKAEHFKHMNWFDENMSGDREFIGILLYTGTDLLRFGKNRWAVPISAMWAE